MNLLTPQQAADRLAVSQRTVVTGPTYFGLLAEFGAAEIPLETLAPKYLGLTPAKAKAKAQLQQLPFPVYRAGSQKSPWLVSAAEFARWLDQRKAEASAIWKKMQG